MKKNTNCYFDGFVKGMEYACQAAVYLEKLLAGFKPENLETSLVEIHKIEHAADLNKHGLMELLAREFITPIEREDIILMLQQIDDVTDCIEDVVRKMYMYGIRSIRTEAVEFAGLIVKCAEATRNALIEMPSFRKSTSLKGLIICINELEEAGDRLHLSAVRGLYISQSLTPEERFTWTEMLERLETCCDKCEDVGDSIEMVILKNS